MFILMSGVRHSVGYGRGGQQKHDGTHDSNILEAKIWKLALTRTSDPNRSIMKVDFFFENLHNVTKHVLQLQSNLLISSKILV